MLPQNVCTRKGRVTMVAFVWLFSTVCFQMLPQIACLRGCIITLVAFVWLLSTVCFHMPPQIPCLRGCKVTLVAFVWLFTTVRFQMCPQSTFLGASIVTLVALVWLCSRVCFYMIPQSPFIQGCIITLVTFVKFFPILRLHLIIAQFNGVNVHLSLVWWLMSCAWDQILIHILNQSFDVWWLFRTKQNWALPVFLGETIKKWKWKYESKEDLPIKCQHIIQMLLFNSP